MIFCWGGFAHQECFNLRRPSKCSILVEKTSSNECLSIWSLWFFSRYRLEEEEGKDGKLLRIVGHPVSRCLHINVYHLHPFTLLGSAAPMWLISGTQDAPSIESNEFGAFDAVQDVAAFLRYFWHDHHPSWRSSCMVSIIFVNDRWQCWGGSQATQVPSLQVWTKVDCESFYLHVPIYML